MNPKRKLKNISVSFISLVNKAANNKTIIYKSDIHHSNSFQKEFVIQKMDEDKKILYGIVYVPDEVDLQGDFASADDIQKMAYLFMKEARTNNVDQQHNFVPGDGFVAESWIIKESDSVFPDIPKGAWAVAIQIENEDTWQKIKSGEISGLSMAGTAEVETLTKNIASDNSGIISKMREVLGLNNTSVNKQDNILAEQLEDKMDALLNILKSLNLSNEVNNSNESLLQKIAELEKINKNITQRLETIEKFTSGSKQAVTNNTPQENSIWL